MQAVIELISGALIPILFILAILIGLIRRTDVFGAFLEGASEGLPVLVKILPCLAGMLMAIRVFTESGLMNVITNLARPLFDRANVDANLLPLILLRPISGSGSMALIKTLMDNFGPDSLVSYTAAILMGSSETIFYEAALYFGSVNIKKTRYAVPVSLAAMFIGTAVGLIVAKLTY